MNLFLFLFIIPFLQLLIGHCPSSKYQAKWQKNRLNIFLGKIEWAIGWWRNGISLMYVMLLLPAYFLQLLPEAGLGDYLFTSSLLLVAFSISLLQRRMHIRHVIRFLSTHRSLWPSDFFDYYYSGYGPLGRIDEKNIRFFSIKASNDTLSLKEGVDHKISHFVVLNGVMATIVTTRLILAADRYCSSETVGNIGDVLMRIWGGYLGELARIQLSLNGLEQVESLKGAVIFAPTHQSFFDLAVIPMVLASLSHQRGDGSRRSVKLRFLAAKDHFLDNIWFYRILGIGRAMEIMGMIFVDRSGRKSQGSHLVDQAARQLLSRDVDILLFPQGTRALGHVAADGSRLGSGYYTSGSIRRLMQPMGHLKKGVAHLALSIATAFGTQENKNIFIVPISVEGIGRVVPKKHISLSCGQSMTFSVGSPIKVTANAELKKVLDTTESYNKKVDELMDQLDQELRKLLRIDEQLWQRFREEHGLAWGKNECEENQRLISGLSKHSWELFFSTLDALYSLPFEVQREYITPVAHWLSESSNVAKLQKIKGDILSQLV